MSLIGVCRIGGGFNGRMPNRYLVFTPAGPVTAARQSTDRITIKPSLRDISLWSGIETPNLNLSIIHSVNVNPNHIFICHINNKVTCAFNFNFTFNLFINFA